MIAEITPQQTQSNIPTIPTVLPDSIQLPIRDQTFTLTSMGGEEAQNWMISRLMCHWRQLTILRNITTSIVSAPLSKLDKIETDIRDTYLDEMVKDFLTLNNILVATSLKTKDAEFVKSLSENEKYKIIGAQDQLNGLDILKQFQEAEQETLAKKVKDEYPPNPAMLSQSDSKKLSKILKPIKSKKLKKQKSKKSKKG